MTDDLTTVSGARGIRQPVVDGEVRASGALTGPESEPESGSESEPEPPARSAWRSLLEWVGVIVCALALAAVLQVFLVQAFSIPSRSMEPTLSVGDRVVVYKLGYRWGDIGRGDVVVFDNPSGGAGDDDLIKRVVALGGETFELRDGRVYIDGRALDEPYLKSAGASYPKQPMHGCVNAASPEMCIVPEGSVLVLGDNRQSSRDSRYFGPIDTDTVIGRAFLKYWPPNDVGGL